MSVVASDEQKEYQTGAGRSGSGLGMVRPVQAKVLPQAGSPGGWFAVGLYQFDMMTGCNHDSERPLDSGKMRVGVGEAGKFPVGAVMGLDTVVAEIQSADMLQLVVALV